jgi:hypothetical protein
MSTADTRTPFDLAPWLDAEGNPPIVRALPGLSADILRGLKRSYPGVHSPEHEALLQSCSGFTGTELGHIDFTGCWFPLEPCAVFRPCVTLAIDDAGRRWIAETNDTDIPGPVWCIFPDPKVAMRVCDDLAAFVAALRDYAIRGRTLEWLQDLRTQAQIVWTWRHSLGRRPFQLHDSDEQIRRWLGGLPSNAYVYDLRQRKNPPGWPYGLAGASGQLYRCDRLPVFAVAGSPSQGWYQKIGASVPPSSLEVSQREAVIDLLVTQRSRRRLRHGPLAPPSATGCQAAVGF